MDLPGAAGILITDDGVDLAHNEIQEIEWMRKHTPTLFPWVNQCGDGTEWLARAGTPYAVPELYSVAGTSGNATAMAMAQLGGYDSWIGESQRFGKLEIKLSCPLLWSSRGHFLQCSCEQG